MEFASVRLRAGALWCIFLLRSNDDEHCMVRRAQEAGLLLEEEEKRKEMGRTSATSA